MIVASELQGRDHSPYMAVDWQLHFSTSLPNWTSQLTFSTFFPIFCLTPFSFFSLCAFTSFDETNRWDCSSSWVTSGFALLIYNAQCLCFPPYLHWAGEKLFYHCFLTKKELWAWKAKHFCPEFWNEWFWRKWLFLPWPLVLIVSSL